MKENPKGEPQEQLRQEDAGQPNPPPLTAEIGNEGGVDHPEGQQEQTEKQQKQSLFKQVWAQIKLWLHFFSKSEWVMVFLTFVIAATGIVGIILIVQSGADTQKMIHAAQQQACAAKSFSKSTSEIDTKIGLAEQDFSQMAKNSEGAIKATQAQMRLDQRAWIGVEEISSIPPIPEEDKIWDISASLKNTGKTPAKNILMWNTEVVVKEAPNVNSDCAAARKTQASRSMLPPNGTYKALLHVANGIKTPKDWESEITAQGALYVHGCVIYDDVFRQMHWMTYCGVFDLPHKGNGFLACQRYNNTGDGEPPH
jgi:hypothetical protein